jgi:hypothetical protein
MTRKFQHLVSKTYSIFFKKISVSNINIDLLQLIMAVDVAEPQLVRLKFVEPDTSKDPWDCGYVASPDPKEAINKILHKGK